MVTWVSREGTVHVTSAAAVWFHLCGICSVEIEAGMVWETGEMQSRHMFKLYSIMCISFVN